MSSRVYPSSFIFGWCFKHLWFWKNNLLFILKIQIGIEVEFFHSFSINMMIMMLRELWTDENMGRRTSSKDHAKSHFHSKFSIWSEQTGALFAVKNVCGVKHCSVILLYHCSRAPLVLRSLLSCPEGFPLSLLLLYGSWSETVCLATNFTCTPF